MIQGMTLPTKIPLRIRTTNTSGGRLHEPITFGVPFGRGRLREPGTWRIEVGPISAPVATTVLDRWADGSVRWMLVDTQVPPDGDIGALLVPVPGGETRTDTPPLRVDAGAGTVVVDTGAVRLTVTPGGPFPFTTMESGAASHARASATFSLTDAADQTATAMIERVTIIHQNRLRATALAVGHILVSGRRIDLSARIDLFAGLPVVRPRCTIANRGRAAHPGNYWDLGDSGSVLFEDVSLEVRTRRPIEHVAVSPETGQPAFDGQLPLELYQDSSGGEYWVSTNHISRLRQVPITFRGYRITTPSAAHEGLRATPALVARAGTATYGVAVPAFWQNFPRAVEARGSGVAVRFFPRQYADAHELQGGEQKTHECWLAVGEGLECDDLSWCREPAIVAVSPAWVLSTEAVEGLAELEPGHRALVDQAIEGPDTFERKREVIDEYGWRHFGDVYGDHEAIGHKGSAPLVSHYNNQYDPILGFGLQFLRTGDPRWRRAMDELAAHVIDIDIYHTDKDKSAYNGGMFWHTYHYGDADTSTHRTYPRRNTGKVSGGGPSADHNYPSGLVLHYFLSGDALSRETAVGLADYVIRLEDGRLTPFRFLATADTGHAIAMPPANHGPSRSSGNSLNALVEGHRLTGDDRYLQLAERLIRRCVHPHDDPLRHGLDDPEYRWFYTMFLQSLGRYLAYRAERGLVDEAYAYARASLLHYARWMAANEYPWLDKPEKLEFPTETWAAQDIRKSDIFCHAALHSHDEAERTLMLDRAAFFHRNSVETLARMPTRSLARPVIVLLTSGLWYEWMRMRPDARLPISLPEPDYGVPEVFVPQRQIALRRAKVVAAGGAVLAVAGLVGLVAWVF